MERLLFNSEVSEIIPYDLKSPLVLYPVRHHSPVCSYHLIKTIERYKPDIILIEGPENASHLISVLTDENTTLPAAFYYYYKDKKKLVSENGGDFKCYYPFLYSSPEYNAALQAKKLGIPAEFIDLPYSEILINTAEKRGLRKDSDKHSYSDDSRLMRGRFYDKICDKTGIRSFEEFWEKYFEICGLYLTSEEFVKQMNTYCFLTRIDVTDEELISDGTDSREKYMAYNVINAMKKYNKVLAVTGGFHTYGIHRLIQQGNVRTPKLHKIAESDQGSYPMAYSYRAADALRGYASGMMYPGFYDSIMKELLKTDTPQGVYNSQIFSLLTTVAKVSSKKDIQVTISDMTAAYTMMNGLAALRDTKECGISELKDAVTACFIKGEKTVSSSLPLDILSDLATGHEIGHIGDNSHIPPLISDFEKQCSELGIKYKIAVPVKVEAALFTSKKGIEVSRFMHRMEFLETGFAKMLKGPDIRRNRDRSRVREEWQCRRSPEVDASLIDHTTEGFTIEEACENYAEKILINQRRCSSAAAIAVDCFLMGISLKKSEQELIDDILRSDGDFFSIGSGLRSFDTLCGLQNLYEFEDASSAKYVLQCFERLISALPSMANVPSEKADEMIEIMKLMYSIVSDTLTDKLGILESSFISMISAKDKEPAVFGAAMGILCTIDLSHRKSAEGAAKGYLSGSLEVRKKGADYLRGLFSTARDIVFTESSFMETTDKLIRSMDFDDFLEILPSLRLAFSNFTPSELQQAAKAAAELHETDKDELLKKTAVNEKMFIFGEEFDKAICRSLNKEELLYEN